MVCKILEKSSRGEFILAKKEIVKYRSSGNFNIGVVIFFIIIIYVLFNIFSYFTKSHIAEYQVQQGTIASNNIYQGIIVRDETVEYAEQSGYINYYVKNASKVSVNDVVYSIDTDGDISKAIKNAGKESNAISKESLATISMELDAFTKAYNSNQFSQCYTFYNNLNTELAQDVNTYALSNLSEVVNQAENNHTFYQMKSIDDGIIVYEVDGFEDYTIEDIINSDLNYNNYKANHLFENEKVKASDPVYKRINSEEWNIVVPISKKLAKELNGQSSVKIRFCKDDFTTNASSSVMKQEDNYFLNISLKKAMIRYANDRFIDIELVMNEKTGLKIPQSAITTKEFFTIPKEFFTTGGDSSAQGLMIKHTVDGVNTVKLVNPTLYYETEDHYYVDSEDVSEGDLVLMPNSQTTYQIGTDKDSLIGVYNINKGYAVFKQINIIYENEEYAIVETKTAYGISLYDHIALDASEVKENQLTSK
ncbi:MAG: hypothetical protein IJE49_09980 [Agathobacter sp.]|nr:hypothetical protein [Agathobacter sp.]